VSVGFGEAFDRERAAWRAGHGGDDHGWAIEGDEGQRLRHKWEDAVSELAEVWDLYSRLLHPRPPSDTGVGIYIRKRGAWMTVRRARGGGA
jgi:hypothetical protein